MLVGDSIENCFTGDLGVPHIAFIGTGFPSAPASTDWRLRPYFLVGVKIFADSGVFFLLARFGDGAVFSDVDDSESDDELDISLSNFRFGVCHRFCRLHFEFLSSCWCSLGIAPGSFSSWNSLSLDRAFLQFFSG